MTAPPRGTGSSLAQAIIITSGVAALVASLLSLVVPIYAASSWTSIISLRAAQFLDPIRDIYEAFTIYTFFQLLINFLGGERSVIIMAHGRPPVSHAWPLNHVLKKIDISDPHTFLAVKRGILQYAWLKPVLALVSIIMKATDTYEEGYLGITSGYLWTGIVYNLSVTISLYSLAMFWVCLHDDLTPFRPVPKFLSVKLIIFASYWQGFFLSILQWLGAMGNGLAGYTPDNLAAAIQDSLICFEMPIFAIVHWYAFSWHDYADPTISAARLPVKYALRDAFGILDLVEDTKITVRGENYEYRLFDSGDNVIAHEESHSRVKRVMDGMRYERGGKAKYWIPKPGEASKPGEINSRTPLLTGGGDSSQRGRSERGSRTSTERYRSSYSEIETAMDDEDERLFTNARALEFGDWNYPVITANEVPRDQRLSASQSYQGSSQAGGDVKKARSHRKGRASGSEGRRHANSGNAKANTNSSRRSSRSSEVPRPLQRNASSSSSQKSQPSQRVDLVVEDHEAEEEERVQTQRELGSAWAGGETRRFSRPTGQPIEEENETEAPTREAPAKPAEDRENRSGRWAYDGMEEDNNVWGR
ncbi:Organic solute transporter Ost-alpha [Penicillium manginii]|uniref:Organic solute transporter Ost-alpha n=1 Tax=Penicillium manginii TaxID=203109 RepID=UPI0025495334|nr:Organic solute transporter Ost-alpha [Penicillium manginii]KAJ5755469.1 Organic solute transporter Ost-alpha [Penicillium manginii]